MLVNQSLSNYIKEYKVQWAITMPINCPPEDISVPTEHIFFRYSLAPDTYSIDDFKSYSELNPAKDWGEMLPMAVGLSVMDNEQKTKTNMRLPYLKRFKGIIVLTLNPADGVVKQTGIHKSHYTWWRTMSFDMSDLKMLEL